MRRSYVQLYCHLVWSTWDRLPVITPALRPHLYSALQAKCEEVKVELIAMGGIEDNVHLLVKMPAALSVSQLAGQLKGSTSHLVTHDVQPNHYFRWQGGYGAFTVSESQIPVVSTYIERQAEHHSNKTFDPLFEVEV